VASIDHCNHTFKAKLKNGANRIKINHKKLEIKPNVKKIFGHKKTGNKKSDQSFGFVRTEFNERWLIIPSGA
jgi:hypothetical protein